MYAFFGFGGKSLSFIIVGMILWQFSDYDTIVGPRRI